LAAIDASNKAAASPLTYVDFEDEILSPGSYTSDAAMSLVGTLYLNIRDAENEVVTGDDLVWYLYLTGALTTGAASHIVFVDVDPAEYATVPYVFNGNDLNGNPRADLVYDTSAGGSDALTDKVHWKIHGAVTVGVASIVSGDVKSNGAIMVGEDAQVGNLEALGAITLGPGSVAGDIRATGALTIGGTATVNGDIYNKALQSACTVETLTGTCGTALALLP
jgi:hypothetical protein